MKNQRYLLTVACSALFNFIALQVVGQSFVSAGSAKPIYSLAKYNGDIFSAGGVTAGHLMRWNGTDWDSVDLARPLYMSITQSNYSPAVSVIEEYNGELYMGGHFDHANGAYPDEFNIRKWNGTTWSSVGTGVGRPFPSFDDNISNVLDMEVYNGELYVGGRFTKAGGVTAYGVAKWDGTSWSAVGSGLGYKVTSLVVYNGALYAGGEFGSTQPIRSIAKWDGTSWTSLGNGMNNPVFSLAVHNGELYAGGCFDSAGTVAASHIAKWNGTSWSALGTGITGPGVPKVTGLASYDGMLYASGGFTTAGGQPVPNFARWDGTSWSEVGEGTNGGVAAYLEHNSELFLGGVFSLAGGLPATNAVRLVPCTAPPAQSSITGHSAPCVSTTGVYTVMHVPGEIYSYNWTLPSGWSGSSSGNSIAVTVGSTAGNITVTPSNACGTGAPLTLAVTPPNVTPLVITQAGNILVAPANLVSYQWYNSAGPIVGATGQTYTVLQDDNYHLMGTDPNGCVTQSNIMSVTLGIESAIQSVADIQLYPNPNRGVFTIKGAVLSSNENLQFEVRDVTGRLVKSGQIEPNTNSSSRQIALSNAASGLYVLKLISAGGGSTTPFVIK